MSTVVDPVETETPVLNLEDQLLSANEKVSALEERIKGLEKKTESTNDLAKMAKELKREKMTAEEKVAELEAKVEELTSNQGVVLNEAEKIKNRDYDDIISKVDLDEEQRKLVDYHYKNSVTIPDETKEGKAKRLSLAIAAAGIESPRPDQLLSVASMAGAPPTKKSYSITEEERKHMKNMGISEEEWVKYRT